MIPTEEHHEPTLTDTIKLALETWMIAYGPDVIDIAAEWVEEKEADDDDDGELGQNEWPETLVG